MIYTPPHTASKDELIGTLLQLWRADCPLALNDTPEDVVLYLQDNEDGEQARCSSTNDGKLTPQLELIRHYLKTADELDRLLTGAINQRQLNEDTGLLTVVLHTDERDPEQYENGYFTTSSAYRWADEEFNIQITKWAPPERQVEPPVNVTSTANKSTPALENNEIEKLEVLIALLAGQLASRSGEKFGSIKKPNCLQISNQLRKDMESQRIDMKGFSDTGMRRRLSSSLKTALRYTTEK